MKKKLLSLLVVICVVFSILPQTTSISSNNESLNSTISNSNDAFSLVSSNERSVATYGATTTGGVTISQKSDYPIDASAAGSRYIDTNTGYLYVTGLNSQGGPLGLGHATTVTSYTAMRMSNDPSKPFVNPVDWSFSYGNGAIIDVNGKVWTAGSNSLGALGNGTFAPKEGAPGNTNGTNQYSFEMVESIGGNSNYKAIKSSALGNGTTGPRIMVMLEDGSLWGAGDGARMGFTTAEAKAAGGVARLGSGTAADPYVAGEPGSGEYFVDFTRIDTKLPSDDNKIKDFNGTSASVNILTTKGNLYTVGTNTSQMGGASSYTTPKLTNVVQISSNKWSGMMALLNDGTLWVTGGNGTGQLGLGLNNANGTGLATVSVFTQVDTSFLANGEFITQVNSGEHVFGILTNKGNLYMAGRKANMGIGVTSTSNYYTTFTLCHTDVVYFSIASSSTFIMFKEGNIVGVGTDSSQLGGSSQSDASSPDAGLNPPADDGQGGGITPPVTLPPFTPNPESYPQDEYDKLPEEEKEDLTKPTEPESPTQPDEGGEGSGFEGEDGNTYTFTPPA